MKTLEGEFAQWTGPVDEREVVAAEEYLGVPLPSAYRSFLLRYGSGSVGSHEIYGLGCPRTGVPNLLWLVDDLRDLGLQRRPQLIPFYAEGDGAYSAVLAAPLSGHPPGAVVYWSPRRDDVINIKSAFAGFDEWVVGRIQ